VQYLNQWIILTCELSFFYHFGRNLAFLEKERYDVFRMFVSVQSAKECPKGDRYG